VLASLSEEPLFLGATILTAFNDNALITYLATLVPDFSEAMKLAVVEGAVTGGGLTIIANAPNPAGQAILSRFFGGVVLPIYLFMGALVATLLAIAAFRLLP
jgi:Na+/H+ antiporter NhaD/arsenite permease-like protein